MRRSWTLVLTLVALAVPGLALAADPAAMVICAPGYPGSTVEAQGAIDALVGAIASGAKWDKKDLNGTYFQEEKAGLARMGQPDTAVVLAPAAFFLEHAESLKLTAKLGGAMKGREATESWALVAKKGALPNAAALDGWTVASLAGFSPRFVKGALAGWGKLPETVKFQQSGQILSLMRKAAKGEKVAILMDGEQVAALASAPQAAELEVVHKTPAIPSAVVATVAGRLPDAKWKALADAMLKLGETPDGAKALEGVQKLKFVALDEKALAALKKAFAEAK